MGGQSGFSSSLYSSQAPTGSGFTLGGQLGGYVQFFCSKHRGTGKLINVIDYSITATQQVTGLESITRATKFIDLPEDVKKHLLNVEYPLNCHVQCCEQICCVFVGLFLFSLTKAMIEII